VAAVEAEGLIESVTVSPIPKSVLVVGAGTLTSVVLTSVWAVTADEVFVLVPTVAVAVWLPVEV
jgi:hypothetical protein